TQPAVGIQRNWSSCSCRAAAAAGARGTRGCGCNGRSGRNGPAGGPGIAYEALQAGAVVQGEADAPAHTQRTGQRSAGAQERPGNHELAGRGVVLRLLELDFSRHASAAGLQQQPKRVGCRNGKCAIALARERDRRARSRRERVAAGKRKSPGAIAAAVQPAQIRLAIVERCGDLLSAAAPEYQLVVGTA